MADCDNDQECEKIVPGEITPKPLPTPSGGGGTSDFNALDNRPSYGGTKMSGDTDIPNIENLIPDAATASNQLADKNFVNSSVATNTANFVGTFDTIEELEAVENPSNNDYGFVMTTDSAGNTIYNRYKFVSNSDTHSWSFEYALNNSSFTASQWEAIQSGITSGGVAKLNALAQIESVGAGLSLDNNELTVDKSIIGKARLLTTDDYNYPSNNPTSIALWNLPYGLYYWDATLNVKISTSTTAADLYSRGASVLPHSGDAFVRVVVYTNATNGYSEQEDRGQIFYLINKQAGSEGQQSGVILPLNTGSIVNSLNSNSTTKALSANQGKVLKQLVDSLAIRGAGAPTTATVGQVGTLYEDTTNGDLYICTDATNPYVWEEVGGGGGGPTVVQTTGTSTTDVMSQDAVTSMVFADPGTKLRMRIGASGSVLGDYSVAIGHNTYARGSDGSQVVLGSNASSGTGRGQIVLGGVSTISDQRRSQAGVFSVLAGNTHQGYNNTVYRLLEGLYDGQDNHDAATFGQVVSYSTINGAGAPTTATEGKYVGQLYYDTTNEAMYFLKTIDTTTDPATYTWEGLGGGGGPTVVQTTGTSTTNVMSQNAVTSMVFADPSARTKVQIGDSASVSSTYGIAIGAYASAESQNFVALGSGARKSTGVDCRGSVALGSDAVVTERGQVQIGTSTTSDGYRGSSNYRLLSGLYDPQSAHDAATKGYVDPTTDSTAPTTATVGRLGQIHIDTTTGTAYMCVKADTITPEYTWKQITA